MRNPPCRPPTGGGGRAAPLSNGVPPPVAPAMGHRHKHPRRRRAFLVLRTCGPMPHGPLVTTRQRRQEASQLPQDLRPYDVCGATARISPRVPSCQRRRQQRPRAVGQRQTLAAWRPHPDSDRTHCGHKRSFTSTSSKTPPRSKR